MMGDFSAIISQIECSRIRGQQNYQVHFANMINSLGMIDLGFTRSQNIWARGLDSSTRIQIRLEREFYNLE